MIRESVSLTKNEKSLGPSFVVSEIVKAAEEAGDMITDLVNQIIAEKDSRRKYSIRMGTYHYCQLL